MTFVPLLVAVLASTANAGDVPRSGYFGAGINLEPLALGPMQAFSGGRVAVGVTLQAALQVDLGSRWALRVPLEVGTGGSGDSTFSEVAVTPGLLYRWRSDAGQRWVPYLGGGLKLGAAGAGREFLGLPLVTTVQSLDLDFDDGDGESDPNFESRLGVFPEIWAGVEWHPNRWFALNLGAAYTYVRLLGTNVHLLHERVGVRFSF
ncbi:hypothetical protein JYK02_34370 [Corallococcus macrosporus]|uniref:Outer membrane protein beta-barrel domain-containing protein n=1 Tax=Corallococcus macrosporus TaxID=35 RepID=A0ABS3DMS0_9BACT|nr:hypothetical protein [Corallococcus macrosporus]MBN8232616.1 hypothetical protein [Corallococcus macrosporus]